MALRNLIDKARRKVDERGGTEALKADADRLRNIAKGPGSASEKAKRAKEALSDPGRGAQSPRTGGPGSAGPPTDSGTRTRQPDEPPSPGGEGASSSGGRPTG